MSLRFAHWPGAYFIANLVILNMCLMTLASAQDQCREARQKALTEFYANAYTKTVVLLNFCLKQDGLSDSTKIDIYALLSRAHLANKDSAAAVRDILSLLDLTPAFVPDDINYTSGYRKFFDQVKAYKTKKSRSKKWLWIGGGAAATTGVVLAIISRKTTERKVFLPDPPGRPQ